MPQGGGPAFDPAAITNTAGALSLRCLQGRIAMLPTQLLILGTSPLRKRFVVPALYRVRKGWGTAFSRSAKLEAGPPGLQTRGWCGGLLSTIYQGWRGVRGRGKSQGLSGNCFSHLSTCACFASAINSKEVS